MAENKKDEEQEARKDQLTNWWEMDSIKMCEEGAWFRPETIDGGLVPFELKLIGKDSKVYASRIRRYFEKAKKKKSGLNASEIENERYGIAVACTVEWRDMIFEGKPWEFTQENVEYLYRGFPWVFEQVEDFIGERANFLS